MSSGPGRATALSTPAAADAKLFERGLMSEIDWRHDARVDARGLACPLPVLKARKALLRLAPGQRLLVDATDKMAAIDVPHFCGEAGHRLVATERGGEVLSFLIERGEARAATD
jgi:tRNA 2-thiouridine synthesizing protein A